MNYDSCEFDQLRQASEELGVEIQREGFLAIATGDTAFAAAPAAGLEGVPATELRGGLDVGVAHLADEERGLPAGFYAVHAQADVEEVGLHGAAITLREPGGGVVQEFLGTADVRSLAPPIRPPAPVTQTVLRLHPGAGTRVCFRCPNGWIICWYRLELPEVVLIG